MSPTEPAAARTVLAEKIRQLRLRLAETSDEPQRHLILRQIEQLEDETKQTLED